MDDNCPLNDNEFNRNNKLDSLRVQHPFIAIVPNTYVVRSLRFDGSELLPKDIELPSGTRMIKIQVSPYMLSNDVYVNLHGTASDMSVPTEGDDTFVHVPGETFFHVENTRTISICAPINSGVVSVLCFI